MYGGGKCNDDLLSRTRECMEEEDDDNPNIDNDIQKMIIAIPPKIFSRMSPIHISGQVSFEMVFKLGASYESARAALDFL